MAAVTNDLIYEVMTAMQAPLGNPEEGQRDVRGGLKGVRGTLHAQQLQLAAVHTDIGNLYEAFGARDARIARIARHLDIIDVPAT